MFHTMPSQAHRTSCFYFNIITPTWCTLFLLVHVDVLSTFCCFTNTGSFYSGRTLLILLTHHQEHGPARTKTKRSPKHHLYLSYDASLSILWNPTGNWQYSYHARMRSITFNVEKIQWISTKFPTENVNSALLCLYKKLFFSNNNQFSVFFGYQLVK